MEGQFVFDLEKCDPGDSKAGGEKMVKGCKVGNTTRKRLADITNDQQQSKQMNRDAKQPPALLMSNDYVDKLYKENMTLMKVVADRNKVIELSEIELQKLKVNFQKAQQQNFQLAQANSQILAELNSGKDQLRVLQHELGCKNGLLKAIKLERERKEKAITEQSTRNEAGGSTNVQAVESLSLDNTKNQPDASRKRQSKKSSLDHSVLNIEKVDDKSRPSRRQSARFKAEKPRPTQDLFEINEAKFQVSSLGDDQTEVNCSISRGSSSIRKEKNEGDDATKIETRENHRTSVGRPSRQAVGKVQSYKETPLNVKMRRDK